MRKAILPSMFVGTALLVGCEANFEANPDKASSNQNQDKSQVQDERQSSQNQGLPAEAAANKLDERTFLSKAASGGLYEVKSSKLALERDIPGDLKSFAQRMIDDHSKANDQLKALAAQKGISVSDQMMEPQLDMYNQLQGAQGGQFAQLYRDQQMKAHQEAVKLFHDAQDQLSDSELRNFAAEKLPILKEHQQMLMPGVHHNQ